MTSLHQQLMYTIYNLLCTLQIFRKGKPQ
jgi:hypothetical protein